MEAMTTKEQTRRALEFIQRDYYARVQAAVAFGRGQVQILYQSPGALLIYDHASGLPMLCADSLPAACRALAFLGDRDTLLTDDGGMSRAIMDRLGFDSHTPLFNVVYEKGPIQIDTPVRLLPLDPGVYAPAVIRHYSLHSPEEIRWMIAEQRILGGFMDGEMVGFVGWHEENSMGLLHVFEEHRRKGYAYAMEALQINLVLGRGEVPFGQVMVGNEASMALQRKLGFTFSGRPVDWLWRE